MRESFARTHARAQLTRRLVPGAAEWRPEIPIVIGALWGNPRHDITPFHHSGAWSNGRTVLRAGAETGAVTTGN